MSSTSLSFVIEYRYHFFKPIDANCQQDPARNSASSEAVDAQIQGLKGFYSDFALPLWLAAPAASNFFLTSLELLAAFLSLSALLPIRAESIPAIPANGMNCQALIAENQYDRMMPSSESNETRKRLDRPDGAKWNEDAMVGTCTMHVEVG